MKNLFLVLMLLAGWPLAARAADEISQINFVTEIQTVVPNTASKTITVQTQNAAGGKENLSETADLFLQSTSATGEFSSNATNWRPVNRLTMANGSANRNFYYRDSAEGSFTLTARVVGQDSNRSWEANQVINVGEGAGGGGNNPPPGNGGGSPPPPDARQGQDEGTDLEVKPKLSIGIGRPRLTTIGSPLDFFLDQAGTVPDGGLTRLVWSFGDGTEAEGSQTKHFYHFPGSYAVVANAYQAGRVIASARTTVTVVDPGIKISAVGEYGPERDRYLELANPSEYEINLGGWRLTALDRGFIFPPDTLISPRSKVKYPAEVLGFYPTTEQSITLFYPNGFLVDRRNDQTAPDLAAIKRQVDELAAAAKSLMLARKSQGVPVIVAAPPPPVLPPPSALRPSQVAAPAVSIDLPRPENWLARRWHSVSRLWSASAGGE